MVLYVRETQRVLTVEILNSFEKGEKSSLEGEPSQENTNCRKLSMHRMYKTRLIRAVTSKMGTMMMHYTSKKSQLSFSIASIRVLIP